MVEKVQRSVEVPQVPVASFHAAFVVQHLADGN